MNAPQKKFALSAEQIKPLATGRGGCIATDRITVDGRPVGYMERQETTRPGDSGWRFTAGDENQAYMSERTNHQVYDVNTIANYSPDIIEFLDAPPRSAFERNAAGQLVKVPYGG
ncbi:DUF2185 domain-containing protein [Comamonas koreensis]|jgi:hypothetical protein|uniref:DUF2185 domain-containing protein n=1 Tax=Comamonas koreensis TaxID=160825 RepID=A0AAW4XSQ0_9BURK|nr:DUF2185 domain-containing protein [Comamonas koreensis]MCD2164073.1 DUF2185 domain-containing protein [Comamonas koreensis]